MKKLMRLALVVAAALAVALPAAADQHKKDDPAAAQAGMPMPKPGPEHKLFQEDAGTWNAKVEMWMAPGAPPMVSTGVEVNTVGCGGLCLISDFKGEMMQGVMFHGHGTSAYDPAKKKYVGTWTDSMSAGISMGESTYDAATKTATGWMEGTDPSGKKMKSKAVVHYKSATERVMEMYNMGPDGKESLGMRITYTKQ